MSGSSFGRDTRSTLLSTSTTGAVAFSHLLEDERRSPVPRARLSRR